MSAKTYAKGARDAIDREDWATALRLSDAGLAVEESHYSLLLFRGLALCNLSQWQDALQAYQAACRAEPDMPAAWKGIIQLVERCAAATAAPGQQPGGLASAADGALLGAYTNLLRLTRAQREEGSTMGERAVEYAERLARLHREAGRAASAFEVMATLFEEGPPPSFGQHAPFLDDLLAVHDTVEAQAIKAAVEAKRYKLGAEPLAVITLKATQAVVSSAPPVVAKALNARYALDPSPNVADRLIQRQLWTIPTIAAGEGSACLRRTASEQLVALARRAMSPLSLRLLLDIDQCPSIRDACLHLLEGIQWEACPLAPFIRLVQSPPLPADGGALPLLDGVLLAGEAESPFAARAIANYYWEGGCLGECLKWANECSARMATFSQNFAVDLAAAQRHTDRLRGLALGRMGRHGEAIAVLTRNRTPKDAPALEQLILSLEASGAYEKAIALYGELLEAVSEAEPAQALGEGGNARMAAVLSDLGRCYYLKGALAEAIAALKEALEITTRVQGGEHPGEDSNELRGTILTRLGMAQWFESEDNRVERSVCLTTFLAAAKADPSAYEPFYYLALYYGDVVGDRERARKCLLRATANDPHAFDGSLALAQILLRDANDLPSKGNAYEQRISLLATIKRLLEPFREDHRQSVSMWTVLGATYGGLKDASEAAFAFQSALKCAQPKDEERILLGLAGAYLESGRLAPAQTAYARLLATNATLKSAIIGAAAVTAAMGNVEEAFAQLSSIDTLAGGAPAQPDGTDSSISGLIHIQRMRYGYDFCMHLLHIGCVNEFLERAHELLDLFHRVTLTLGTERDFCRKLLGNLAASLLTVTAVPKLCTLLDLVESLIVLLEAELAECSGWRPIVEAATLQAAGAGKGVQRILALALLACSSAIIASSNAEAATEDENECFTSCIYTDIASLLLTAITFAAPGEDVTGTAEVALDCADKALAQTAADAMESGPLTGPLACASLAYLAKGIAHLHRHEYALSQHSFIASIKENYPSSPQGGANDNGTATASLAGWIGLAMLYYRVGNVPLALASLERLQLAGNSKDSFLAWFYEAFILTDSISATAADGALASALRKDPMRLLDQAAQLAPHSCAAIHALLALSLLATRKEAPSLLSTEEEEERIRVDYEFKKALAFDPTSAILARSAALASLPPASALPAVHPTSCRLPGILDSLEDAIEGTEIYKEGITLARLILREHISREAAAGHAHGKIIAEAYKLISYAEVRVGNRLQGMHDLFMAIEVSIQSPSGWRGLKEYYMESMASYEKSRLAATGDGPASPEVEDDGAELRRGLAAWLRMRITTEVASSIYEPATIEAILDLWQDGIPVKVGQILGETDRFHKDCAQGKAA